MLLKLNIQLKGLIFIIATTAILSGCASSPSWRKASIKTDAEMGKFKFSEEAVQFLPGSIISVESGLGEGKIYSELCTWADIFPGLSGTLNPTQIEYDKVSLLGLQDYILRQELISIAEKFFKIERPYIKNIGEINFSNEELISSLNEEPNQCILSALSRKNISDNTPKKYVVRGTRFVDFTVKLSPRRNDSAKNMRLLNALADSYEGYSFDASSFELQGSIVFAQNLKNFSDQSSKLISALTNKERNTVRKSPIIDPSGVWKLHRWTETFLDVGGSKKLSLDGNMTIDKNGNSFKGVLSIILSNGTETLQTLSGELIEDNGVKYLTLEGTVVEGEDYWRPDNFKLRIQGTELLSGTAKSYRKGVKNTVFFYRVK